MCHRTTIQNVVKRAFIFIVLLILSGSVFLNAQIAQATSNEIKATLILHFCENVTWKNPLADTFNIACISADDAIFSLLKPAEKSITIQGRPFSISKVTKQEISNDYNAIYYGNNFFNELTDLFNFSKDSNILLITSNVQDELFVLINIIDGADNVTFRVNMPNLTLAGFTVKPNLLLNGGSVVDINSAYDKFEERLENSKLQLEESQLALIESENQLALRDSIINLKEEDLENYMQEIEYYKTQSSALKQEVEQEKEQIQIQRKELNGLLTDLQNLQSEIQLQESEYATAKEDLNELNREAETLRREIEDKNITLQQQDDLISSQRKRLILSFSLVATLLLAGFALFRLFALKKKHNTQLAQKVEERTRELKLSNDKFQAMFNLAPIALWEVDFSEVKEFIDSTGFSVTELPVDGSSEYDKYSIECVRRIKFINVNKAALDLYKINHMEEMAGIYGELHRARKLTNFMHKFNKEYSGNELHTFETDMFNKLNNRIELIVTFSDISESTGSFSRVIVSQVDITRLRQIENELKKHQNKLELLVKEKTADLESANEELRSTNEELYDKSKIIIDQNTELKATLQHLKETQAQLLQAEKMASLGVLTAGVAHEINNPLNYIMGAYEGLQIYKDDKKAFMQDKDISILLNALKTGIDKAANIVKSLNQFSRDSKNINEVCYIHDILDNCLTMIQNQIKNRLETEKNYCHNDIIVEGNIGKLHQVFLNLLTNAEDAISGTGKIIISTRVENEQVIIEIKDTGIGISEEDLPKITDPFYTTKSPGEGTGLGLFITYNIIREHYGTIKFESDVNIGTTVYVSLPLKDIRNDQ